MNLPRLLARSLVRTRGSRLITIHKRESPLFLRTKSPAGSKRAGQRPPCPVLVDRIYLSSFLFVFPSPRRWHSAIPPICRRATCLNYASPGQRGRRSLPKLRLASDTTQTDRCDRPLPRFFGASFFYLSFLPSLLKAPTPTNLTCMPLRQYVRILKVVPFFPLPSLLRWCDSHSLAPEAPIRSRFISLNLLLILRTCIKGRRELGMQVGNNPSPPSYHHPTMLACPPVKSPVS